MSNCKDNCIHYRVRMYGDLTEYKTEQILKDDCDDYMSNDVVPKSEVYGFTAEELAQKCESLSIELEAMRTSANSYKMHYENAKQEVAREIFKEMQSCLIQRHWNGLDIVSFEFDAVKYAELKKKYTESEDK